MSQWTKSSGLFLGCALIRTIRHWGPHRWNLRSTSEPMGECVSSPAGWNQMEFHRWISKVPDDTSTRNSGSCFLRELLAPRLTWQMRTDGCRAGELAQITVVQFIPLWATTAHSHRYGVVRHQEYIGKIAPQSAAAIYTGEKTHILTNWDLHLWKRGE